MRFLTYREILHSSKPGEAFTYFPRPPIVIFSVVGAMSWLQLRLCNRPNFATGDGIAGQTSRKGLGIGVCFHVHAEHQ
jgi:hypothetical protein